MCSRHLRSDAPPPPVSQHYSDGRQLRSSARRHNQDERKVMNQAPSKLMMVLPNILGTIGALAMILGCQV